MEAYCKCRKFSCFFPGCDRLVKLLDEVQPDLFGNPLYTAVCDKTGEVFWPITEGEIMRPPEHEFAATTNVATTIKESSESLDAAISTISSGSKDRYLALDPVREPIFLALAPLTERFVYSSAKKEDWALMKCNQVAYSAWRSLFHTVNEKFRKLFEALNAAFPNAAECSDAERKCFTLFDRIYYHGCQNYIGPRKGFDKRGVGDFYQDFINALARLSDFVKSKDKPFTKSGHKARKPPKQKRGPKITSYQSDQISLGERYCNTHPKKWVQAARHALALEQTSVQNGVQMDGYIAHSGDYEKAVASLARAIARAAKAKPKR